MAVDTALTPLASHGDVRSFRAELSRDWEIWGPNGGYLATVALRAAGACAAIPRPASFYCHFLAVAQFAPVELHVRELRRGRRTEALQVSLEQDGRAIAYAMLRTAAEGPGLEHDFARMPEVRAPESLPSFAQLFPDDKSPYAFWLNLDSRPTDPESYRGEPRALAPAVLEWHRFVPRETFDDPFVDAGRLLILLDTLGWPAAARAHPSSPFQAPSLDVCAFFHRPAAGCAWLLADHVAPVAEQGLIGATGRVWSADGRLLASGGAQLLCVPAARA